jgi:hypothetical protein
VSDDDVVRVEFEKPDKPAADVDKPKRKGPAIPVLKPLDVDPEKMLKPDQRAVAAVNLRLAGAPFVEIAKELGYSSPKAAETAYVSALAEMYPVESWENLRQIEAMRAEVLLRQALAMAQADFFVDANDADVLIPNTEKARWHDQALKALQVHAMITGARAPARLEVSASTQELHQMVTAILQAQGGEPIVEADIFQMDEIPQIEGGS